MPLPREHILAEQPAKQDVTERLYKMATVVVNDTEYVMSQDIWLYHLSLNLSIPEWQCVNLWKRLKNEKKIKNFRKIGYKWIYLAVNKQVLDPFITTVEQYHYKFKGESR